MAGKNYDAREVDQIRLKRMIASDYMDMSIQQSQAALMKRIDEGMAKLDPSSRQIINQIMQAKMLAQFVPQYAQQYEQTIRNAPMYMSFLSNMAATAQKESTRRRGNNQCRESGSDAGFPGAAPWGDSRTTAISAAWCADLDLDAIADYLLWLNQADQLGIVLNKQDISQEIADETGGITAEAGMAIDRAAAAIHRIQPRRR